MTDGGVRPPLSKAVRPPHWWSHRGERVKASKATARGMQAVCVSRSRSASAASHILLRTMVVTGSNERLVGCGVPDPLCSYWITAAGLLGKKSLVDGRNAAKGSRQTGCAPSEDAVAPEARPQGPGREPWGRRASAPVGRLRTLCGTRTPRPCGLSGRGRAWWWEPCGVRGWSFRGPPFPRRPAAAAATLSSTQWLMWN
jgi:hypothetical protein